MASSSHDIRFNSMKSSPQHLVLFSGEQCDRVVGAGGVVGVDSLADRNAADVGQDVSVVEVSRVRLFCQIVTLSPQFTANTWADTVCMRPRSVGSPDPRSRNCTQSSCCEVGGLRTYELRARLLARPRCSMARSTRAANGLRHFDSAALKNGSMNLISRAHRSIGASESANASGFTRNQWLRRRPSRVFVINSS